MIVHRDLWLISPQSHQRDLMHRRRRYEIVEDCQPVDVQLGRGRHHVTPLRDGHLTGGGVDLEG